MPHHPPSLYERAHAFLERNEALNNAIGYVGYYALVASMAGLAIAVALRLLGLVGGAA